MGAVTKIQWCHHTFNPWRGCSKVHTGCENCYAWRDSKRFPKIRGVWGPNGTRVLAANWREPIHWNAAAEAAGERRRVFCASLADVFEDFGGGIHDHKGDQLYRLGTGEIVPEGRIFPRDLTLWAPLTLADLRRELFALIDATPWLDWLLVTKRPERIGECWAPFFDTFNPRRFDACGASHQAFVKNPRRENVWLMTSVSDQATADEMIPRLLEWRHLVPVLGVSAEPLLGPIDFTDWIGCTCSGAYGHCDRCLSGSLDWIILGGESGHNARPCEVAWLTHGIGQCQENGVACFVKQLGSKPLMNGRPIRLKDDKGGDPNEWPADAADLRVRHFPETALQGAPR